MDSSVRGGLGRAECRSEVFPSCRKTRGAVLQVMCSLLSIEREAGIAKFDHVRLVNQIEVSVPYLSHGKHVSSAVDQYWSCRTVIRDLYLAIDNL